LATLAIAMVALVVAAGSAAPAVANTEVKSNITTNTTWTTSGSPYDIDAGIKVTPAATLTIEPGVTVDFNNGPTAAMFVEGTIKALGSAGNPVVFTSHQALSGAGAPGQYLGVRVASGNANSRFSYSDFFYGGNGSGGRYAYAVLSIAKASTVVTVDHSTFEQNAYSGIKLDTLEAATANVSYSTFSNNGGGLSVGGPAVLNLSHSTMSKNVEAGAYFISTSAGSSLTYNTITENGKEGVQLSQSCTSAPATFAHGEYNNIYANGTTSEANAQLRTTYKCEALPVDWRNNYWGGEVYYYYNDKRCSSTATPYLGHLAYMWSKPPHSYEVPVGPITSDTSFHSEKVESKTVIYYCGWDSVAIGPGEFLASPVPNAGASPGSGSPEPTSPALYGGGSEAAPNLNTVTCGDPVNCVTGDFFESYRDLTIPGLNGGLSLSRTYNSQAAATGTHGPFGYGWSSTFSQTLSLDPSGQAATVTNADGSVIVFTKNAEGAFTAPAWVQATLATSGENFIYTLPNQRAYTFSGAGRLLKVVDRNANTTTLSYNEAGRLETVTDPGGRKLTFAYNSEGLIESVKDPMGHVVKYTYEGGTLASVTQPGEASPRWRYKYDASHEMTTITDGRGGETLNEYDGSGRVVSQSDRLKHKTTWTYTSNDTRVTDPTSVTDVQFAENLPTQITRAYGTASAASTKYGYDAADNVTSVTDPLGHITKYGYDGEGNRTSVVDPIEHETKWTYDATHDVLSITAPSGEKTAVERDAHGNATSVSRPAPGSATQVTNYKYDTHGNLEAVTDPLERVSKYEYDSYGDQTGATDAEGDRRTWSYDEDSREISSVNPRGHVEGAEASKYTTTIERDAQGRAVKVTDELGHTMKYTYDGDGNLEVLTDAAGHTTRFTYDADDETVKVERPNKATAETTYDAAGRVVTQTDGNKHTTTYVRDVLEEVTEVVDPLGRTTHKEYDASGRLKALTDAAERTSSFTYDAAGRLKEVSYSDGVTPSVKSEYNVDGYRTKMIDGSGTTKYTYDQLDRLTESKDGHGDVVAYEYDLANELTKTTYPGGKSVTRTFDSAGRLASVTDWLEHTTKFGYDADANLTSTTYPAGTGDKDTYAYDAADQMSEASASKGSETLAATGYVRNNLGQVTQATSHGLPGPETTNYAYDENNRLAEAAGSAYEYDAADNPIKMPGSTNAFDHADQLETGTGVGYGYDELGERTKRTPTSGPATTYAYNESGVLTSVTRPEEGEVAPINDSYTYNGDRLRVSETTPTATRYWTWDVAGRLPVIVDDGRNSYVYGPQNLPVEQVSSEGVVTYLHHDQQGSTRLLTGSSGTAVGSATYDALGNKIASTGNSTALGYDAQYADSDTGLIYLRARSYDPATGQFVSVDPLAAVTRSPYGYAGQDPLSEGDPSGLCSLNPFSGGNCYEDAAEGAEEVAEGGGNLLAGAADTLTGGLSTEALDAIGIEPNTCSTAFQAGKYLGYAGLVIPGVGEEELATEGIYIINGAEGVYVGQSGSISSRLAQHVFSGRFTQNEVDAAERIAVSGGRLSREVAEQQKIDELGGIGNLMNQRNPIGPQRFGLIPQPYERP
jgi:RHS repeat-associated protein